MAYERPTEQPIEYQPVDFKAGDFQNYLLPPEQPVDTSTNSITAPNDTTLISGDQNSPLTLENFGIAINKLGYIRSGQSSYNTGSGWFLGSVAGITKFSIGNPATKSLTWDGTNFTINGYVVTNKGTYGGDGSDGALSISAGTTTIDLVNAAVVVKNYTSISITGTAKLAFSNPATGGTIIIIKSQGNVTITSSTSPAIDLRLMGGSGGLGGTPAAINGGGGGGGGASPNTTGSTGFAGTAVAINGAAGSGYGLWILGSSQTGGAPGTNVAAAGGVANGIVSASSQYSKFNTGSGSGGGGGGEGNLATGGNGGRGGGGLWLECNGALNITGIINASGAVGSNGVGANGGGGGGGGGGSIVLLYTTLTANTGTYTVSGGAGGTGFAAGGAGAAGFSLVANNISFP